MRCCEVVCEMGWVDFNYWEPCAWKGMKSIRPRFVVFHSKTLCWVE